MSEKIKTLIVEDVDGKEYEFTGGSGGSGSTQAPNSVNSQTIEDESIQKVDLDKSIQEKLDVLDESNVVTEEDLRDDWAEAMEQAGLDLNPAEISNSVSDEEFDNEWDQALHNAGLDLGNGSEEPKPDNPDDI